MNVSKTCTLLNVHTIYSDKLLKCVKCTNILVWITTKMWKMWYKYKNDEICQKLWRSTKKWDNDEFYKKKNRWSRLTQIEIKKKVFKINKVCCIALFVLIVYVCCIALFVLIVYVCWFL